MVDLYLYWPTRPESADETSEQLGPLVGGAPRSPTTYDGSASRSARVATGRSATSPSAPTEHREVVEDDLTRGVHPMVGRRLNLWRLRNFDVTRVEAPEDVLLYECVARENPADRRLVALAQVRQIAVVRDETARSRRCRTPNGRWRTAWRRSVARAWRAAPPAPSST